MFFCPLVIKAQSPNSYFVYTVTEEDKSLWAICQHHNVNVETVKALNKLTRNSIRVGKELKIPKQTQIQDGGNMILHVVTKEDKNLWRICQRYAVMIDTVQKINGMESSIIKLGAILKIPNNHLVVHTATRADKSLWRICKNYGVNLTDLKEFNNKKNNSIHRGDRILIPKEWISQKEIIVIKNQKIEAESLWQSLGKPVFDLAKNKSKFPSKKKKTFRIDPKLVNNLALSHKLDSVEYVQLYQQSSQQSSLIYNSYNYKEMKNMYYYSIEEPFLLDLTSLDYYPLADKSERNIEHGYAYDFVTIIEIDSAKNTIQIIPVFLYKDYFGNVEKYFGKPNTGAFSCCASPHPLAYYSKTSKKETIGFSELLSPSVLKYTEVNKRLQDGNIVQTDSSIVILQLETFDIPTMIDIEEYKNGKKIQGFVRTQRRKKLGY
jgi:LysM repeat protein